MGVLTDIWAFWMQGVFLPAEVGQSSAHWPDWGVSFTPGFFCTQPFSLRLVRSSTMSTALTANTHPSEAAGHSQSALINEILGVAIFDLNGLPREYFVTAENENTHWVQIVFQALGLKSLLMSSMKLDNFHHICIDLNQQTAVVVRTKNAYVALLIRGKRDLHTALASEQFSQWVRQFEQDKLRQHPRFKPA